MSTENPVAVGFSKISLYNLSREEIVQSQWVLELYDGGHRIQVEFEDLKTFLEIVDSPPNRLLEYFQNNLFESPEMDDPGEALVEMAHTASEEGLVTVPTEDDDGELFDAVTSIFQKAVDHTASNGKTTHDEDDFLQSLLREED